MDNKKSSLYFFTTSFSYLQLVENSLEESIRNNNIYLVASDHELLPGEYEEQTKWSDFNVIIPVYYDFYHGLELIMKGLLLLFNEQFKFNHDLELLYEKVLALNTINVDIKNILRNYITKEFFIWNLRDFVNDNKITISQMYQAFRYPLDPKLNKNIEYYHLHFREEDAIPFYRNLISDSKKLRKLVVELYKTTS